MKKQFELLTSQKPALANPNRTRLAQSVKASPPVNEPIKQPAAARAA